MKKILTLLFSSLTGFLLFQGVTLASNLHVSLPDAQGYQDVQRATNGQSEITSNSNEFMSIIRVVNEYLRIAIGIVCMAVLIINGIKLITARGDEAVMKKATNALIGAIVGIVIAIFAYLIVRMALNLF